MKKIREGQLPGAAGDHFFNYAGVIAEPTIGRTTWNKKARCPQRFKEFRRAASTPPHR
jgi:hypothetical protein